MDLQLIKFPHKMYHNKLFNNLPIYFNDYIPRLEKSETRYNLRSHRSAPCSTCNTCISRVGASVCDTHLEAFFKHSFLALLRSLVTTFALPKRVPWGRQPLI